MIPPCSDEEALTLPKWVQELRNSPPQALKPGDRVYDILYCGMRCGEPMGTVMHVSADGTSARVDRDDNGSSSGATDYLRLLPREYDPRCKSDADVITIFAAAWSVQNDALSLALGAKVKLLVERIHSAKVQK